MTDPMFAPGNGARPLESDLRSPPSTPDGADAPPMPRAVRPSRFGLRDGAAVIGYVTAPGDPDAAGADPSRRAIEQACQRAGWRLLDVLHEIEQRRTAQRPALSTALQRIADGEARGLVVSHARLLGDSIVDLAALMTWFREARAAFIALDLGLDTSTPQGTRVAMALIRLSGWDRGGVVNGERNGLAELRARNGSHRNGSHRNGSHQLDDRRAELLRRLAAMEDDDMSLQEMADQLNADGVPTLNGSDTWWPSSVRTALRYARATRITPADLPVLEQRRS
jgi:DNA invertase Pin-like site-specific DNA recombinase